MASIHKAKLHFFLSFLALTAILIAGFSVLVANTSRSKVPISTHASVGANLANPIHGDSYIVIDTSGSISSQKLDLEKQVGNAFNNSFMRGREGIYTFNSQASLGLTLTNSDLKSIISGKINSISVVPNSATDIAKALTTAKDRFLSAHPDRFCSSILLISDGKSTNSSRKAARLAADAAYAQGIELNTVTIKPSNSTIGDFMKDLATRTGGKAIIVYAASDVSKIDQVLASIASRCTPNPEVSFAAKVYRDSSQEIIPGEVHVGDRIGYSTALKNAGELSLTNLRMETSVTEGSRRDVIYVPGTASLQTLPTVQDCLDNLISGVSIGEIVSLGFPTAAELPSLGVNEVICLKSTYLVSENAIVGDIVTSLGKVTADRIDPIVPPSVSHKVVTALNGCQAACLSAYPNYIDWACADRVIGDKWKPGNDNGYCAVTNPGLPLSCWCKLP